jgi:hypothetical protein
MSNNPQYREDSFGRLVPIESIKPLDLLRDDTVMRIVQGAKVLQETMVHFKQESRSDVQSFMDLAAEQYGTKLGGHKGNLTLVSFNGQYKVLLAISDKLEFDERLQIAKQLVDECIHDWAKDSNVNTRTLVEHAFQTDKQGKISTSRIFGLMRVKIEDEKWQRAMAALKDSIQVTHSSEYLRIYEREEENGQYKQVVLDFAGL